MSCFAQQSCACPILDSGPSMVGTCASTFMVFMTLLQTHINSGCDLADPCNRVQGRVTADDSYDFVVVGGGTAGPVVAAKLSANPQWKVLLIEAGGDEPTPTGVPAWVTPYWDVNETDWMYQTEPQQRACLGEDGRCRWPRGKMLGGSSSINGMMYMRGHPADYDAWAVNGAAGWSWHDVFPAFLQSEDNKEIDEVVSPQYHSKGGPLSVQRFRYAPQFAKDLVTSSMELGIPPTNDLNGRSGVGFTIAQTLNDGGVRVSASKAYLRPNSKRGNLHVLLNTMVSRVVVDPTTKTVTGVEYTRNGEKKIVGVKREAVLTAGALNTPQILLLSGIGPKETLDKFNIPIVQELPGVGQNLQNHIGVLTSFTLTKEAEVNELNYASSMEYLLKRTGPLAGTGLAQLTGMLNSRYAAAGGRQPDLQFFFYGYSATCADGGIQEERTVQDRRNVLIAVVNLQPRSRGYVSIRSTNPFDAPIFQPNYLYEDHDIDVIVDGAKTAYKLANTTLLREKYGMEPDPSWGQECGANGWNPTEEYLRCLIRTRTAPENHQVGTAKMGPRTDPMAVVDMRLKVHGVNGLRVMDASVMPVIPTGNTAAPVIMIAERGSNFILHSCAKKGVGADEDLGNRFGDSDAGTNQYGSGPNGDKGNSDKDSNGGTLYSIHQQKPNQATDGSHHHWDSWKDYNGNWDRNSENDWHKHKPGQWPHYHHRPQTTDRQDRQYGHGAQGTDSTKTVPVKTYTGTQNQAQNGYNWNNYNQNNNGYQENKYNKNLPSQTSTSDNSGYPRSYTGNQNGNKQWNVNDSQQSGVEVVKSHSYEP